MSKVGASPDLSKVKKDIEQGRIASIYVIYGTQKLVAEEILTLLHDKVLDEEDADFNYEVFDMREQSIQLVVEAAETFPFMGDRRLVVARESTFLTASREPKDVEHDLDVLLSYASDPVDHSVLVLMVDEAKLDERKKLVKTLKKSAAMVACQDIREDQLLVWLKNTASEYGVQIDQSASQMMVQLIGSDMQMLKSEMGKIANYVGQEGQIDTEAVEDLVSRSIEQDVFKLVDHVAHVRTEKALDILHELLKQKEEPIKILFLLARQYRIIYRVMEMSQQGHSRQDIASKAGVRPFVVSFALDQARLYSERQIRSVLKQLAEIDHLMKSGKMEKVLALELFLLRLGARRKKKNTYQ